MVEHGQELATRLDELPFARSLYYEYNRSLYDGTELSQFERALRFFYALRGTGTGWMRRSPVGWAGGTTPKNNQARSYHTAISLFKEAQARFRQVIIDNRDIIATIKRYDSPRTLFYVDTPYLGAEQYYESSKRGFPHTEVAELLNEVKGQVAFSCYPHPLIEEWYPASRWRRLQWQQAKSSQIQMERRPKDIATEMLLCNYSAPAGAHTLWELTREEEQPAGS